MKNLEAIVHALQERVHELDIAVFYAEAKPKLPAAPMLPPLVPWSKLPDAVVHSWSHVVGFWVYWGDGTHPGVNWQGKVESVGSCSVLVHLASWVSGEFAGSFKEIPLTDIAALSAKFFRTRREFLVGLYYDKVLREPWYRESVGTIDQFLKAEGEKP